jgi:hypothetical protein
MKVIVPSSLADITLSQYLRYLKALESAEANPDPNYMQIITLEIFCNLTRIQVMDIEYSFVATIYERIIEILKQEPQLVTEFKVGNLTFGWIPKLDDLKYGEFVDLNNNISDWENIVVSMGVLYRPITFKKGTKYLVEEYKGDTYHDALKEMPMSAVVGAMVFFWNLGIDCTNSTLKYLETQTTQTNFQKQLNLVDAGIGIQQSMNSLVQTLQNMKR